MVIPLNPQQLPQQTTPMVNAQSGVGSNSFFYILRALFNRTGGNSGIPSTVGNALTAAGASQADALTLADDINEVTTGGGGVALTALQPGQSQQVYNGLGGNLNVYPAGPGQINALGASTPHVLAAGTTQIYTAYSIANGQTQYRTQVLG